MSRYSSSAGGSHRPSGSSSSTNPFDSQADASTAAGGGGPGVATATGGSSRAGATGSVVGGRLRRGTTPAAASSSALSSSAEPAIWAARNVEWPIPSSLSSNQYQKLLKASRQAALQLGIKELPPTSGGAADQDGTHYGGSAAAGGGDGSTSGLDGDASSNKYYGGLMSGFMSRVLNTSAASDRTDDDLDDGTSNLSSPTGLSSVRPLRPPRTGCVAAANGWIVTVVECPHAPHSSSASASSSSSSQSCLRLISRWNVRRGGGLADPWIALPPPTHGDGKIAHVLVDPTASHILISAYNGEAYYLHASQKTPIKLAGFGDPTLATLTGIPAAAVAPAAGTTAPSTPQQRTIQLGLTPHTYVTSVAWDKERGTEGSSKKILLGTSGGEIYEYSLNSPNADDAAETGATSHSGGTGNAPALPMLLHQLHRDPETRSGGRSTGKSTAAAAAAAAVTGIYLERLRTGLLVLVASSGRRKRTRFGTFYSAHSTNLALPFQATTKNSTLTELPGSVDFADLRVCNDTFGLRTDTGIYFGKIDRNYTTVSVSNVVVESGILPYANQDPTEGHTKAWAAHALSALIPVSLALTPHHLITLSDSNEVRFINRVALKVVQRERVEVLSGADDGGGMSHSVAPGELLMDIRRPDQVWLRRGRSLVHISASQEDRDVWKFTLQKCLDLPVRPAASPRAKVPGASSATAFGTTTVALSDDEKMQESLFEQAKTLCTNAHQKAVVTAIRAEYHLQHGRGELAAKYLAQCPASLEPFADTAIRLALPKLGVENPHRLTAAARETLEDSNLALIAYLSEKMRVGTMNDDKMTSTMIGAWLTELYLHERGERVGSAAALTDSDVGCATAAEVEAVHRNMLARFLNSHVNHMDAKTIMKILTSHDVGAGECAVYAARSGDISTAVNAALSVRGDDAVRNIRFPSCSFGTSYQHRISLVVFGASEWSV